MKITFLGTGHGIPAADRFCSSALLEIHDSLYLIDAGAPVADLMQRYHRDVNKLKAVFLTHAHGDHTDGLIKLTDLCQWWYRNASFDIFVTENRLAEAYTACVEAHLPLSWSFDQERIRYRLATEGEVYRDEHIKITYYPTLHYPPRPSYAILIEAEGKKVLCTGDLSQGLQSEDFPQYALENKTDVVICEMAHFDLEQAAPYLERLQCKKLYWNHVAPVSKFDQIRKAERSGAYPFSMGIARDGDTIDL